MKRMYCIGNKWSQPKLARLHKVSRAPELLFWLVHGISSIRCTPIKLQTKDTAKNRVRGAHCANRKRLLALPLTIHQTIGHYWVANDSPFYPHT